MFCEILLGSEQLHIIIKISEKKVQMELHFTGIRAIMYEIDGEPAGSRLRTEYLVWTHNLIWIMPT